MNRKGLIERLGILIKKTEIAMIVTPNPFPQFDWAYAALSHHRKRILSVLRRARRCQKCFGRGYYVGFWDEREILPREYINSGIDGAVRGYDCECCGGTGRIG